MGRVDRILRKSLSATYNSRNILAGFVALTVLVCSSISVSRADTDAWGSVAQGLGGTGTSWGEESFAAFFNPARLTQHFDDRKLNVGWGLNLQTHEFTPIKNVVVENDYSSDQVRHDHVDTKYRDVANQTIGVNYLVAPQLMKLSAGVTATIPVMQLAYLDTGETLIPEYVLYRARSQRPRIHAAVAVEPLTGFSVGAGVQVGFSVTARAAVFLQSGQNKPSTMRFIASLKPKASPYFGLAYTTPNHFWTTGVTVRLPLKYSNYLDLQAGARAFGNSLVGLDFNFAGSSMFFYDPLSAEVGTSLLYTARTRLILQADYEAWSAFQVPSIVVLDPATSGCGSANCGISLSPGISFKLPVRDIIVPRVGHEVYLGERNQYIVRAGYFYRPSIFKSLPTGTGNFLDPDKHGVSFGFGLKFQTLLGHAVPWSVDIHGQYQSLANQVIRKTAGDELGNGSGDLKIGAPGYEAGGKIYGGGISATIAL